MYTISDKYDRDVATTVPLHVYTICHLFGQHCRTEKGRHLSSAARYVHLLKTAAFPYTYIERPYAAITLLCHQTQSPDTFPQT